MRMCMQSYVGSTVTDLVLKVVLTAVHTLDTQAVCRLPCALIPFPGRNKHTKLLHSDLTESNEVVIWPDMGRGLFTPYRSPHHLQSSVVRPLLPLALSDYSYLNCNLNFFCPLKVMQHPELHRATLETY